MSQAETVVSPTCVLAQLLDPLGDDMPLEYARKLAALTATPAVEARLEQLAEKSTEGELTPTERIEYTTYVVAIDLITILQAKARGVISRQSSA